jgi:hypothetical protein
MTRWPKKQPPMRPLPEIPGHPDALKDPGRPRFQAKNLELKGIETASDGLKNSIGTVHKVFSWLRKQYK